MAINKEAYQKISSEAAAHDASLVAVSKTKPAEDIMALYQLGHRDFGENYVQELVEKAKVLPGDIRWHFIGHLQTNKVKLVTGIVQLIQGVDSLRLLEEINKQSAKAGKKTECLLQIHIAVEETKFGFDPGELETIIDNFKNGAFGSVTLRGLMGMASLTADHAVVRNEFRLLKKTFDKYHSSQQSFDLLSMGMSGDYDIALEEGSTMIRVGSLLFGERQSREG